MKLKCDLLVSKFAFKSVNLCRYTWAALKDYRRKAEARIEELERRLHPLEGEVGALRLFKDAMASSERTMIMRKGGGFIALEEYVATVVGTAAQLLNPVDP